MKKIIAISGSPGAGKTTVAIKTAQEIYFSEKCTIAYISSDYTVPFLASVFPADNIEYTHSLGKMFDRTEINKDDVLKAMYNAKGMDNFVFFGYKSGENRYSYPSPTGDKINSFFDILEETVDYIIVDCQSGYNDILSNLALNRADKVIHVINPNIKSMVYYTSLDKAELKTSIKVINITDKNGFPPIKETEKHFGTIDFVLPYSSQIKDQGDSGQLTTPYKDKKFKMEIEKLAKEITKDV